MILAAAPIGEYDKRITLLTRERGRISAFAKNARRPNNPLMGISNPFSFGEFTLYEGRNSYSIMQASIRNYFQEVREDMMAAYYGFYFLDFAGYYTRENNDETEMLKLLYQTMRVLIKGNIQYELVRYIFELKAICINGEGPQVFECVHCQKEKQNVVFSALKGGLICEECRAGIIDGIPLSTSTLYTLQYIVSSSVEKLYTFTVKEEVLKELAQVMKRYKDVYVEKQFKSLEILETIVGDKSL